MRSVSEHGGNTYGKDIRLDFSTSLNPFGIPKSVFDAACNGILNSGRYPDPLYHRLHESLSLYESYRYSSGDNGDLADRIVPGSGVSELICGLARIYTGRKVLIQSPCFGGYERAFAAAGCDLYYADPGDGFDASDETVRSILDIRPDVFIICNPLNPTGRIIKREILESIAEACKETGCDIICDEAFLGFSAECATRSIKSILNDTGSTVVYILRSFTKLFCAAGLRLGYALCSDAEAAVSLHDMLPEWNISSPSEYAGIAAVSEKEFISKSISFVSGETKRVSDLLASLGCRVFETDVNYIFFEAAADLCERLTEKGIMIRKCDNFRGIPENGYYRIGIRSAKENDELIESIREIRNG